MVRIRQVFSCAPISSNTATRITKPKLVISCCVNTVVCVRKPGPIEELAMRKAAPSTAPLLRNQLKRFDGNVVFLESVINFLRKGYRMCAVAVQTNGVGYQGHCFSADRRYVAL